MSNRSRRPARIALAVGLAIASSSFAARQAEKLDRGLVATRDGSSVFVSWRLNADDAPKTPFNVYLDGAKLNAEPLTGGTNFVDENAPSADAVYEVRAIVDGAEQPGTKFGVRVNAPRFLSIPIQDLPAGYFPNDASAADLDGDGRLDLVVHLVGAAKDNSQSGVTSEPIYDAYTLEGKRLWRINLGKNIRSGAHYTQFMVYDFNGDGRAEMICKTADGTTDGVGTVIGDASVDHRDQAGRINRGPEFLTVFDGLTGKAIDTVDYVPPRHPNPAATGDDLKAVWGDGYGNRGDRYLAAVASLDGKSFSAVMCRGYYTRSVLAAYDFDGSKLKLRWVFDSHDGSDGNRKYAGQGNHNLSVADVDGDGKDEIVYGGMTIDDDGTGLYSTGLGHGDAMHLGDLDWDNPGLEYVRIQERFDDAGLHMVDAKTGKVLWRIPSVKAATSGGDKGEGPGRGASFDIDPRYPGAECWAMGAGMRGVVDSKGKRIFDARLPCNFGIYWDGDDQVELLDGTVITKWNWNTNSVDTVFNARDFGAVKINGTKSNPSLQADLFGDWREEVVYPSEDGKELRVFTTTIPTERRLYTLMGDPQYRMSVAWQNVAYNQPPHIGYRIDNLPLNEPKKP